MYYETRCVFYIPSPEARGYKTHNSFHNTSYGMKIHLRSYIQCILDISNHKLSTFSQRRKNYIDPICHFYILFIINRRNYMQKEQLWEQ